MMNPSFIMSKMREYPDRKMGGNVKIIFWGSDRMCSIGTNMLALAGYLVCQKSYRVTIFEMTKEPCNLTEYFPGTHKKYAKEYIDTLIEKGLYYVSRPVSQQIMERIEWNMDAVFVNLANRTDEEAKRMMKEADVLVVNLNQDEMSFDRFFRQYANLSARIVLLLGNYLEDAACNKSYLQNKYRISDEHIAVIPFNREFQLACEKGQIETYMRPKRKALMTKAKRNFIKELENLAQLLFKKRKRDDA